MIAGAIIASRPAMVYRLDSRVQVWPWLCCASAARRGGGSAACFAPVKMIG